MTTKIEWVKNSDGTQGKTWNPVHGCTKCSPGCLNCYAERMSKRLAGRCGYPADEPFKVTLHPEKLEEPLHWRKPQTVFVCSMGDLFHEDVPFEYIDKVMDIMLGRYEHQLFRNARNHTYQVLTKRPARMLEYFKSRGEARADAWKIHVGGYGEFFFYGTEAEAEEMRRHKANWEGAPAQKYKWPPDNLWLGVTTENQEQADKRIPLLLQTPAAVRFVSCEPLLSALDIERYLISCKGCGNQGSTSYISYDKQLCRACSKGAEGPSLDQVICGGETGPGARPMHPDWARGLRDQCQAAGVPFFFKSWGDWKPIGHVDRAEPIEPLATNERWLTPTGHGGFFSEDSWRMRRVGKKAAGRLLDGVEYSEMPERGVV